MKIDEIVSMIVANGLWAVLFSVLLAFELKDSRRREARYNETIRSLSDRLGTVNTVLADTQRLLGDADEIKRGVAEIKARSVKRSGKTKAAKESAEAVCAATA